MTIRKFCLYAAISIVALLSVLYVGGYWYLRNAYKLEYYDSSFFASLTTDIKTSPALPKNFTELENRINRNRQTYAGQYKEYFFNNILFMSTHRQSILPGNFSKEVYEIEKEKYNKQYTWRLFIDESLVYAFGLEKEFGIDPLKTFYYNNCEYQESFGGNKSISFYGIQAISNYKFGKPVDSLGVDELIELYLLSGDKLRNHFLSDKTKYLGRLEVIREIYNKNL